MLYYTYTIWISHKKWNDGSEGLVKRVVIINLTELTHRIVFQVFRYLTGNLRYLLGLAKRRFR